MTKTFYSNGKLLLTGEYVVLDGATALSIPTRYGQSLEVISSESKTLYWKSFDAVQSLWFEATFEITGGILQIKTCSPSHAKTAATLLQILKTARNLNPEFLTDFPGSNVITRLDFPRNWGLGTSSTLINNIAQWAQVDAFLLLQKSFGGSGYDIASAQCDTPILYSIKNSVSSFRKVTLPWEFTNSLYFIHLNVKQDSKEGINRYRTSVVSAKQLQFISDLTNKLLLCYTLLDFENLMQAHERTISELIGLPTLQKSKFQNYPKVVKSLGAWGGDFFLATGTKADMQYFSKKGYNTIIPFSEMIK